MSSIPVYPIDHRRLTPGRIVDRKQGFFILPAFDYTFDPSGVTLDSTRITLDRTGLTIDNNNALSNSLAWSGASVVVAQYNFTSTNNFVLTELPEPPEDANFVLCIRYRVGDTVYRYKLWEDVGERMNYPMYNVVEPQLILKNFVLEIWTTEQENRTTNPSEIILLSSIQVYQSVFYWLRDTDTTYEVSEGAEFTDVLNQEPSFTSTNLLFWYSFAGTRLELNNLGNVIGIPAYMPEDYGPMDLNSQTSRLFIDTDLPPKYLFPKFASGSFTNISGAFLSSGVSLDSTTITIDSTLLTIDNNNPPLDFNSCFLMLRLLSLPTVATESIVLGNIKIGFDPTGNLVVTLNSSHTFYFPNIMSYGWVTIQVDQTVVAGLVTNFLVSVKQLDGNVVDIQTFDTSETKIAGTVLTLTALQNEVYFVGEILAFTDPPPNMTEYYTKVTGLYGYMSLDLIYDPNVKWLDNTYAL